MTLPPAVLICCALRCWDFYGKSLGPVVTLHLTSWQRCLLNVSFACSLMFSGIFWQFTWHCNIGQHNSVHHQDLVSLRLYGAITAPCSPVKGHLGKSGRLLLVCVRDALRLNLGVARVRQFVTDHVITSVTTFEYCFIFWRRFARKGASCSSPANQTIKLLINTHQTFLQINQYFLQTCRYYCL